MPDNNSCDKNINTKSVPYISRRTLIYSLQTFTLSIIQQIMFTRYDDYAGKPEADRKWSMIGAFEQNDVCV